MTEKSTKYCNGCRDDFYNINTDFGKGECWTLETAKIVTRYKLGWWTPPKSKDNFTKVKTYNCNNASGKYVLYKELPKHIK